MVNSRSTSSYRPLLEAINRSPRFQDGGFVGTNLLSAPEVPRQQQRSRTEVNVFVEGGGEERIDIQRDRGPSGEEIINIIVKEQVRREVSSGNLDRPLEARYGLRPVTFGR